ncbi:MAG: lipopolysaccharide heptosyltransferase family protein [Xanthobacteraceae bacterium]|nr:MAG: lipopolysaccharide heptosyltransferase family protein [Xanthobacteraceae bacterium]
MAAGIDYLPSFWTAAPGSDARPKALVMQKFEALGDAIIRLPAYRALRMALPDHSLIGVYSGRSTYATLFAALGAELFDGLLVDQPTGRGPAATRGVLAGLTNIDVVIDFRSNLNALWSFVGSAGLAGRFIANVPGYALRRGVGLRPAVRPVHNYDRFHRMAEMVAGRALPFDASLPVAPRMTERAVALLPDDGRRYAGLAFGGVGWRKAWPRARQIEFLQHLRRLGLQPVFLLGPYENEERRFVEAQAPDAVIVDLTAVDGSEVDLMWLTHALAPRLTLAVAIEGGIGHVLATQGIPLLTLSGPTDAMTWKPVTPHWWHVAARAFGSNEMAAIPADAVAARVEEILRWSAARSETNDNEAVAALRRA